MLQINVSVLYTDPFQPGGLDLSSGAAISNAQGGNLIGGKGCQNHNRALISIVEQRNTMVVICRGVLRAHCSSFVAPRGFADSREVLKQSYG